MWKSSFASRHTDSEARFGTRLTAGLETPPFRKKRASGTSAPPKPPTSTGRIPCAASFLHAILTLEKSGMADFNQHARGNCSSSGADRLRSARARSRRASSVTRLCLRDRLSKPSANGPNPFRIRRVQYRNRPSYGRPCTYHHEEHGPDALAPSLAAHRTPAKAADGSSEFDGQAQLTGKRTGLERAGLRPAPTETNELAPRKAKAEGQATGLRSADLALDFGGGTG